MTKWILGLSFVVLAPTVVWAGSVLLGPEGLPLVDIDAVTIKQHGEWALMGANALMALGLAVCGKPEEVCADV